MEKQFVRPPASISIPPGADETYELVGQGDRERFQLDVWRGTLRLSKLKLQNRARSVVVLVRLDVGAAPHTNPDGKAGFRDPSAPVSGGVRRQVGLSHRLSEVHIAERPWCDISGILRVL